MPVETAAEIENDVDDNFDILIDDETDDEVSIVDKLTKAWLNERNSPEILPFQFDLIENVIELVENQVDRLELESSPSNNGGTIELAFQRCLIQIELERIKYMLQSYFRCRISKIEQFAFGLKSGMPVSELLRLLSKPELDHLNTYIRLTEEALKESILNHLPPTLRCMEAGSGAANLHAHVIARFLKDTPSLLIDPISQAVEENIEAGDLYVLQYTTVKELLTTGHVELI